MAAKPKASATPKQPSRNTSAAAEPGNQADVSAPEAAHLRVIARKEGFRRAGRAWSASETRVAIEGFTDQQIMDLVAEPMLDVAFVAE